MSLNRFSFAKHAAAVGVALSLLTPVAPAFADAGHAHAPAIGQPAKAGKSTRTVAITLDDNYYAPNQVKVRAGETVRFVLTNRGTIEHEFTIGTHAMQAEHRQMMKEMMQPGKQGGQGAAGHGDHAAMNHGAMTPGAMMHHDHPNAVTLAPGETKEFVWKFGKKTDLEFACNIPTHYETGMVGKVEFGK